MAISTCQQWRSDWLKSRRVMFSWGAVNANEFTLVEAGNSRWSAPQENIRRLLSQSVAIADMY